MVVIGSASATSSVPPAQFHARWCDVETHGEWASSMEWLKLDSEFGVGATGTSRNRDGVEHPFRVIEVEPGRVYADATILEDAELVVRHVAEPDGEGSRLTIQAWVAGPEEEEHAFEMGDISSALQGDLDSLVALLESGGARHV